MNRDNIYLPGWLSRQIFIAGIILIFEGIPAFSQTITVHNLKSQPLPSAHITVSTLKKQDAQTLLTNSIGVVEIPETGISPEAGVLLKITYTGYTPITDTLWSRENKTYYMHPVAVSLNQVVITAQYAPNSPVRSVHRIKIIDREQIEAQGAETLNDVLTNETNIRISRDNILGSSGSVQGISGQNVKVLIDGVPVTGRLDGNIDLSQINLNNAARIEIIEGPLSVNYGTDALAGTINIITKKNQKKGFQLTANTYYETAGQYNMDGRIGFHTGKNTLSFSGGRNFFDGWSPGDRFIQFPVALPADTHRVDQWNPKKQLFGHAQLIREAGSLDLRLLGSLFKEKIINRGMPRKPYYETAFDDYYHTWRWDNSLSLKGKISPEKNIDLIFPYNDYRRIKNTWFKDLTTLREQLTENPSAQDTTKFTLLLARGTFSTTEDSAKFNYQLGYDLNVEKGYGPRFEKKQQQVGDYALFASAQYRPTGQLVVRPGLRYGYNTSYMHPLVPSVNTKYTFRDFTFRFSYARGFRAPSLKELYFDFVDVNHNIRGNPRLKAEASHNFQLAVKRTLAEKARILVLEASAFYNDIRNRITLARSGGTAYTYFNTGRYKTHGLQFNAAYNVQHLKILLE